MSSCTTNISRRPARGGTPARGVTIVELMVAIGVIAVLLAVLLPTLAWSRARATEARCRGVLAQLGVTTQIIAQSSGGAWPNVVVPGSPPSRLYEVSDEYWSVVHAASAQDVVWMGPYLGTLWEPGSSPKVWSCLGARALYGPATASNGSTSGESSLSAALRSYFVSLPLFVDPSAFVELPGGSASSLDSMVRRVGLHETLYPSAKVAACEVRSFHSDGRWVNDASCAGLLASFADGHVRAVAVRDARPASPLRLPERDAPPDGTGSRTSPLNLTVHGGRGHDF